ncbi:MAG: hypothetical protein LBM92_06855 [Opitutaceae bacterium]|jgi:hypothetical protein|nr:hypothetical protein [Opitutaceae bacterium]
MPKKIHGFLFALCALAAASAFAGAPPWRMIYNNDLYNIHSCESPYNPPGARDGMTEAKIRAAVAEAAVPGMGAQLIAPNYGWVPSWQSKLVPLAEHEAWFRGHYGIKPAHAVWTFLREGGDLLGTFIDECHKRGNAALAAFRVNDGHVQDMAFAPQKVAGWHVIFLSRFYVEHPELRRSPVKKTGWPDRVHDWSQPAARAHKEALLRELIETYPALDGVELDFQRYPAFFPSRMPAKERVEIMLDFLKKARAMLDESSKKAGGAPRWLGARVPLWPSAKDNNNDLHNGTWEEVGFDPAAWQAAGVDWFNLSPSYRLSQDMRGVARARKEAPGARIFAELTHTPLTWAVTAKDPNRPDGFGQVSAFRRATKELLGTAARLACARGADGVSLFNFFTYRAPSARARDKNRDLAGPFDEPPFDQLPGLVDRRALEDAPSYFYKVVAGAAFTDEERRRDLELDLKPARGNSVAILRLLVLSRQELSLPDSAPLPAVNLDRGVWDVRFNGARLDVVQIPMPAHPFPSSYKAGFNHAEQYIAFKIPAGVIKDGPNKIRVEALRLPTRLYVRHLEIIQLPAKSR